MKIVCAKIYDAEYDTYKTGNTSQVSKGEKPEHESRFSPVFILEGRVFNSGQDWCVGELAENLTLHQGFFGNQLRSNILSSGWIFAGRTARTNPYS